MMIISNGDVKDELDLIYICLSVVRAHTAWFKVKTDLKTVTNSEFVKCVDCENSFSIRERF